MEKLVIHGGNRLSGEVEISGAKNAAVAIIPATLLAQDVCRIENIPNINDVTTSLLILEKLGAVVTRVDRHTVDIAVLTLPKEVTADVVKRLADLGVRAFWNFTGIEPETICQDCIVENVHLGDSLMTLCYGLRSQGEVEK